MSLIETDSGNTVATTVSSADGTFQVSFPASFAPAAGKPYYRGGQGPPVGGAANRAGAFAARVRTLVAWQGGWSSLSGAGVVIGRASTAVAVLAAYRNLGTAEQLNLLGKLSDTAFAATGTAIAGDDYDRVLALVTDALADDQDPVGAIGYLAAGQNATSRYTRGVGDLVMHDSVSPSLPARGSAVTLAGQDLPSPGAADSSLTLSGSPVGAWTVTFDRTGLTFTVCRPTRSAAWCDWPAAEPPGAVRWWE